MIIFFRTIEKQTLNIIYWCYISFFVLISLMMSLSQDTLSQFIMLVTLKILPDSVFVLTTLVVVSN
jgi:hypothetical protein